MIVWARSLLTIAGMMGAAGVIVAAAGTHSGGGDLARTASEFLLIHAAVVVGLAMPVLVGIDGSSTFLVAGSALALGTVIFSADLTLIAFLGITPIPLAAPIGGLCMIAGWLALAAGAAWSVVFRSLRNKR